MSKMFITEDEMRVLVQEEIQKYDLPENVEVGVVLLTHSYQTVWRLCLLVRNTLTKYFEIFYSEDSPEKNMREAMKKLITRWDEER